VGFRYVDPYFQGEGKIVPSPLVGEGGVGGAMNRKMLPGFCVIPAKVIRHPDESRDPEVAQRHWIPAFQTVSKVSFLVSRNDTQ